MNSKLFKPLNEQIQVVKIKRQGIDDAERDSLIESIINENVIESLTEDVDMAALYEQCLIEAGYDEARADELLLEFLGLSTREKTQKWINKNKNKRTISNTGNAKKDAKANKDVDLYQNVATKYAKGDKKAIEDIQREYEQDKDKANRMSDKTFGDRWAKNKALKKANKDAEKKLLAHNIETYRRNQIEVNDIKKSRGTKDLFTNSLSDNDELVKAADKKAIEKAMENATTTATNVKGKTSFIPKAEGEKVFTPSYTNTKSDRFKPVVTDKSVKAKEDMEKVITDVVKGQPKDVFMPNYTNTKSDRFKPITITNSQGDKQDSEEKAVENKPVENNKDDDFEKRVSAEVEKRYKERQDAINAKRKATYEANRAKKAAETAKPVEPVKPTENKPVETVKPAENTSANDNAQQKEVPIVIKDDKK